MLAAPLADDPFDAPNMPTPEEMRQKMVEAAGAVVDRLHALAQEQVTHKKPIEMRWLEDLRAFAGLYDEITADRLNSSDRDGEARSRAYINMARPKTNAWRARLADLLFPADDRNYGINPTPVPELEDGARMVAKESAELHEKAEQAVERANRAAAAGDPAAAAAEAAEAEQSGMLAKKLEENEKLARAELEVARRRADAMAREIDDQLTECQYPARSRDAIDDACKLGVGILKGPLTANRPRRKWATMPGETNVYQLQTNPDPRPEYRRVDPWSFFPDMMAATIDDAEFTFERHLPTKRDLRKLARTLGFDKDAVRALVSDEQPDRGGSNNDLDYLSQLRAITGETQAVTGRYVLWEYRGNLECDEICHLMRATGNVEGAAAFEAAYDPLDEHMVVIYFCRGRVLKIDTDYVLDSGESLYSVFQFERGEGSMMSAIGVPRMMLPALRVLNGAWRMMIDNGALSSGPQVVIDKTMVEPEDGSWKMRPRKVWLKKTSMGGQGGQNAPFEVFNIPMNQAQLAGIIELALKFIDEETALPLIAQGEQGSHITQTMGGMTMLFNSANVIFRRVVKNWDDDMTTPIIRRIYDWNMQFSDKDDIKGDMQVEARGTSVLLVREMQSQQLMQIATNWSAHPVIGAAIKLHDVLRMTFQSLSLNPDDVLLSKDDFEKKIADLAASQAQSPETIRAMATIETAKIDAASRKLDGEVQLQIAGIRRETALMELAEESKMSVEKLGAMLGMKNLELASKERSLAAEIGTEREMAAEARARGERPTGSGGAISAGTMADGQVAA